MIITDGGLTSVRNSGNYRAAIWLFRIGLIELIPVTAYMISLGHRSVWLLLPLVTFVAARALLQRAGVPTSGGRIADKAMNRQLARDLFWMRATASGVE